MKYALVVLVTLMALPAVAAGNLLKNGDFEKGRMSWSMEPGLRVVPIAEVLSQAADPARGQVLAVDLHKSNCLTLSDSIRIHAHFLQATSFCGVPFAAEILPTAGVDRAAHVSSGNVRAGARSVIDAGAHILGGTTIGGEGFGVNTIDGRSVVIPRAGAVVAGSSTLGDNAWIGLGAVVSSELAIGAGAFVALGSVATKDVPAGWRVFGMPAKEMQNEEKAT